MRVVVLIAALLMTAAAQPFRAASPQGPPAPADLPLRIGMARPGGGHTVTTIPLEAYVARVLAGEAARDSPPAALEALAIAVRTFTLANRGRHGADGFDLCDETHCQVMRVATMATERARERDGGTRLAARRYAGLDLLLGVVRGTYGDSVRSLARRRRSTLPAVPAR